MVTAFGYIGTKYEQVHHHVSTRVDGLDHLAAITRHWFANLSLEVYKVP